MHKSAMVIVRRRRSELSRWERCQLQRRHLDMVVEACSEVFQLMREDPDQFCGNVLSIKPCCSAAVQPSFEVAVAADRRVLRGYNGDLFPSHLACSVCA